MTSDLGGQFFEISDLGGRLGGASGALECLSGLPVFAPLKLSDELPVHTLSFPSNALLLFIHTLLSFLCGSSLTVFTAYLPVPCPVLFFFGFLVVTIYPPLA
jgi:hypothetical protein